VVKKNSKKVVKKSTTKKAAPKKTVSKKPAAKKLKPQEQALETLVELIRVASTIIPKDVDDAIQKSKGEEVVNTTASYAMNIISDNIDLAKLKSQPLCQDTGTVIFYIYHPAGFFQNDFTKLIHKAVVVSTKKGYLRQNSVDSLTGENAGTNLGPGHPSIHFVEHAKKELIVKIMLKGGGCENVSAQYSLPDTTLSAGRDLSGVRKVILDAVIKAQGKGCGPGVLGVCIGGDRADSHAHAKKQLFRKLGDRSKIKELAQLETEIIETCNKLGIGPMGFGGKTTILDCLIDHRNRLPASFFVSISYMCWAFRRQGIVIDPKTFKISKWLY
jgi:fumarate hydratase, class I